MDFLKAFEKAKELGLSKDEFLPIYMREIKNKTDQLVCQNSSWEALYNPDDRASSVWSSASQPQSTWPEWKLQRFDAQKQSQQAAETVFDPKIYLDNMKESLYTQLQDFKYENALEIEQLKSIQQSMNNFLTQIHNDVQILLPSSQDGGSQKQGKKDVTESELFNRVLEQFNEFMLAVKQNIEHSQREIVADLYCIQSNLKCDYHEQVNRQNERFLMQGSHINDNYMRHELTIQHCQTELLSSIKELQSFVVGNFAKICEFQNNFGAAMQQQMNTHQLLLTNTANISTTVTENSNFFKKFNNGCEGIPCHHQEQYVNLPVQACTNEPAYTPPANEDPDTLLDNRIISVFESSAPSGDSIISVIYDFCIHNISNILESRKEFQKVTYDEKLGCCLRASIYFSEAKEIENMLHICLDICQVGRDMILPDFLRIFSEITLVNIGSDVSYWNVAKENGVFNLPKLRENGWFEVCAAFLNLQSSEFKDFVRSGTLSFYYNLTVFNQKADRKQEPASHLPCEFTDDSHEGDRENTEYSHDSDSEYSHDSEYFDAEAEENKQMTRKKASSESFSANKHVVDESVLRPVVELQFEDPLTVLAPYTTYFLPVCGFSALVGSESVIDSQDWYLHFLGHSIHAVLAFLDDGTLMICIDYFHGSCCADLPEVSIYRCRVSLLDQTDRMVDLVLGDSYQIFDLITDTPADWMENCVCMFSCKTIEDRFKNNGRIVLQFDFFDVV